MTAPTKFSTTRVATTLKSVVKPEIALPQTVAEAFAKFGQMEHFNPDLHFLDGVFVTSGMNNNDDFFLPSEMFEAMGTILHKPIDIEHEVEETSSLLKLMEDRAMAPLRAGKNTIVGSIYDAVFLEVASGQMMRASEFNSKDRDELLNRFSIAEAEKDPRTLDGKYHIIIAAALWKFLFPKTIRDIVERVDNKSLAYSMEVWYTGYDYYADGKVVGRYDQPDLERFLEQRLVLGGSRVGRVLRNVFWGGAGVVKNPANPFAFNYIESHASAKDGNKGFLSASLSAPSRQEGQIKEQPNTGKNNPGSSGAAKKMADFNPEGFQQELAKLRADYVDASKQLAATLEKLSASELKSKDFETKLTAAEARVKTLEGDLEKANTAKADATKSATELQTKVTSTEATLKTKTDELTAAQAKVTELTKQVEDGKAVATELATAKSELSKIQAQEKFNARIAELKKDDLFLTDHDTAEAIAKLSDDEFKNILATRASMKKSFASQVTGPLAPYFPQQTADAGKAAKAVAAAGGNTSEDGDEFSQI